MTIDVNRCVGCQTCTIACKHANDTTPGVQWRRVVDVETGEFPDVERLFLVTGCQHCAKPPCVPVCPTGATRQRADGLVTMDYDTCIGCGYCAVSCPYGARTIMHEQKWYYGVETVQEVAVAHPERIGVAQKCTFCIGKIDESYETGEKPGIDLEVTPACAASCIAQAIEFGDLNDPESNVSKNIARVANFQMHEELGTDPSIRYLFETPAVSGRENTPLDQSADRMRSLENPLVGPLQKFWDWRAASNFTFGGMSSGAMIVAATAYQFGAIGWWHYAAVTIIASVGMAIGLFCIFLEIGRKLRFINVLLRPQSSWMTRETYAVAVIYPAVFATVFLNMDFAVWGVLLGAVAFLYCQGQILFAAKGIPNWRVPLIPWLLVVGGLTEGVGVTALVMNMAQGAVVPGNAKWLAAAGLAGALAHFVMWRLYISAGVFKRHSVPLLSQDVLNGVTVPFHILYHAVAILGFGVILTGALPFNPAGTIVGAALVSGGILWKFTVIARASFQQGLALSRWPGRGSGSLARA